MFGPLMHAVKLLQAKSVIYDHCTGAVKRKVNCSYIWVTLITKLDQI